MKVKTLFIGICIISLMGNVSCTETSQKKEEVSVKKLNQSIEQKQISKVNSSNSKTSKKQIGEFPPPPPSVDDDHRNYFIPPLSDDDVAEIRDQQGDYFGDGINEMPQGESYSNENPEPELPQLEIFIDPEDPAEFPGGEVAMKKFINANLIYPSGLRAIAIEGKCYVQFVVNVDGSISNVRIMRGVPDCPECDKEAIRVINTMPKWNPGKLNGKAVVSSINLPITFKMI